MGAGLHMTKIKLVFVFGLLTIISSFLSGCDDASQGFLSSSASAEEDGNGNGDGDGGNSTEFSADDEEMIDFAEAGLMAMEAVEEGTEAEELALAEALLAAEGTGLGSYADARPPSCCQSAPVTQMTWAEFESNHAGANMSQNVPIIIPCEFEVSVTSSPSQTLAGLQVMGHLKFDNTVDVTLTTAFIFVCGKFHIGTEAQSHDSKVEIVLAGNVNVTWPQHNSDTGEILNFGTAGFVTYGGDTILHGSSCGSSSWARLAKTVDAPVAASPTEDDDDTKKVSLSSQGHHRYKAENGIDGNLKTDFMTDVERRPWWQIELPVSVQAGVGIVRVQLPHRSSWYSYTFSGTKSVRYRDIACDVCDGPDEGAIVGISDESCSLSETGDRCSGTVCGTITIPRSDGRYEIDCQGKTGKYVYVLLPGDSRKLWLAEVSVFPSNVGGIDIELAGNAQSNWNTGDKLVITSSSFNAFESEEVTISGKTGQTFQASAVKNRHDGCDPASNANCYAAAEVASLTRNIVIRGGGDCENDPKPRCGHFMIAHTNKAYVCGVEFTNLGQPGNEGRYPMHIHMPGTAPSIIVKNNALHHNHQRGVVLHGVIGATVESNVCYITNGHCFMLEDGGEEHNRIINNIGILPNRLDFGCSHSHDQTFLCPSRSDTSPNAFWIPNTNNIFEGNVGIASGIAYRVETRHVMGLTRRMFPKEALKIGHNGKLKHRVPIEIFKNNVAHSSKTGFFNYPQFNPYSKNGPAGKIESFLSWRTSIGISIHNGKSSTMPVDGARLLEVFLAARAGTGNARVNLVRSKMQGRSDRTSGPFGIKGLNKGSSGIAAVYGNVDAYTRNWARCFGNYRLEDVDPRALAVLKESFKILEGGEQMECNPSNF